MTRWKTKKLKIFVAIIIHNQQEDKQVILMAD